MTDKLEAFRLAALRLDEAKDTLWLAEQTLLAAQRVSERTKAEYAAALKAVNGRLEREA